jgi:hypothetical protein
MRRGEDGLVGTAGGDGELDPKNADGDEAPILKSLRPMVPQVASARPADVLDGEDNRDAECRRQTP